MSRGVTNAGTILADLSLRTFFLHSFVTCQLPCSQNQGLVDRNDCPYHTRKDLKRSPQTIRLVGMNKQWGQVRSFAYSDLVGYMFGDDADSDMVTLFSESSWGNSYHLAFLVQQSFIVITLHFRSTWNQRRNCPQILATVRFYRILQLEKFVVCPFTLASTRLADAGSQDTVPSVMTTFHRSTWNKRCNCGPILATVRLNCILQRAVFDCRPFTLASSRSVDAGIQAILPSVITLQFRSTRH
jgi:hypothetical protein